jgi:hypothetical protein
MRDYVISNGTIQRCSECGVFAYSVPVESFFDYVNECISQLYLPTDGLDQVEFPPEDIENSHVLIDVFDCLMRFEAISNLKDVHIEYMYRHDFGIEERVKKKDLCLNRTSWDEFCDVIKHGRRFFFFDEGVGEKRRTLLSDLFKMLEENGRVVHFKRGGTVYRARPVNGGVLYSAPRELGPPPPECVTQQNRMSPAGIAMFYGANDPTTAVLETASGAVRELFSVASFYINRDMLLLDISDEISSPNIFDKYKYEFVNSINLFNSIRLIFSEPVDRVNNKHNIDYVPTQIFTEYARCRKCGGAGCEYNIDGIIYRSSKTNEKSYVLFKTCDDVYEFSDMPCGYVDDKESLIECFIMSEVALYLLEKNDSGSTVFRYADFEIDHIGGKHQWTIRVNNEK